MIATDANVSSTTTDAVAAPSSGVSILVRRSAVPNQAVPMHAQYAPETQVCLALLRRELHQMDLYCHALFKICVDNYDLVSAYRRHYKRAVEDLQDVDDLFRAKCDFLRATCRFRCACAFVVGVAVGHVFSKCVSVSR